VPDITLASAAAAISAEVRSQLPADLADVPLDIKELKRLAFKGQVHRYNIRDVFGMYGKALKEIRRRINHWPSLAFREQYASLQSTALCKDLGVLQITWDAEEYIDPFVLPENHLWDPNPELVIELLVYCIFDARNPETGLQHVTGGSARGEYAKAHSLRRYRISRNLWSALKSVDC